MRFLTQLWNLKLSCCLLPYLTSRCYSEASLVFSCAFICIWTKLCLCAKTVSNFVSNLLSYICWELPMCSSRGRLWISWGYAHNHCMMLQLAMALTVCGNTRFRQSSHAVRCRRSDRPWWRSDRLWRSDRPWWRSDRITWVLVASGQTGHWLAV